MDTWTVVSNKKRRPPPGFNYDYGDQSDTDDDQEKIPEPCWFYNNGGCRHKDGTEKLAEHCKYLHVRSDNVRRPPHLSTRKPCDKHNLEGECKWHDNCKYSHRNLTVDEWSRYYPNIPYTLKTNLQKRLQIENSLGSLEDRIRIMEYKQNEMSKDILMIKQSLQQLVRQMHSFLNSKGSQSHTHNHSHNHN